MNCGQVKRVSLLVLFATQRTIQTVGHNLASRVVFERIDFVPTFKTIYELFKLIVQNPLTTSPLTFVLLL